MMKKDEVARVAVITEDLNELLHAAEDVIRAWESGDLAAGVRRLDAAYKQLTGRSAR